MKKLRSAKLRADFSFPKFQARLIFSIFGPLGLVNPRNHPRNSHSLLEFSEKRQIPGLKGATQTLQAEASSNFLRFPAMCLPNTASFCENVHLAAREGTFLQESACLWRKVHNVLST